jgi:hypothetical protein
MESENYIQLKYLVISSLVVVSAVLLWHHSTNRISVNLLLFAEITISLALIALLLPPRNDAGRFTFLYLFHRGFFQLPCM